MLIIDLIVKKNCHLKKHNARERRTPIISSRFASFSSIMICHSQFHMYSFALTIIYSFFILFQCLYLVTFFKFLNIVMILQL